MIDINHQNFSKKHLLIFGKSKSERSAFLNQIVENTHKVVYRFPQNLRSFEEYINEVRKIFPFIPANWQEQNPKKWSLNQVWDFHLDWTYDTHSILIIIEEFGNMDEYWKIEILRDYITTSYYQEKKNQSVKNFQLIITQQEEAGLINKISYVMGLNEEEKRSNLQVVKGKLEIINLDVY